VWDLHADVFTGASVAAGPGVSCRLRVGGLECSGTPLGEWLPLRLGPRGGHQSADEGHLPALGGQHPPVLHRQAAGPPIAAVGAPRVTVGRLRHQWAEHDTPRVADSVDVSVCPRRPKRPQQQPRRDLLRRGRQGCGRSCTVVAVATFDASYGSDARTAPTVPCRSHWSGRGIPGAVREIPTGLWSAAVICAAGAQPAGGAAGSCRRGAGRHRVGHRWSSRGRTSRAVRPVSVALAPDVPTGVNTTVYVVRE